MQTLFSPVLGGDLEVHHWPGEGAAVVAIHGITANGLSFAPLARALDGRRLVAPDLRGRAGSRALPGPGGISRHVQDVVGLLEHLDIDSAVIVGHSMGAFVAAGVCLAVPERVESVVLVDGAVGLPLPPGVGVDAALSSVLGPAMERLSMTFASQSAYEAFWQAHPAFSGAWSDDIAAYVAHDLVGEAPHLTSSCRLDAVRDDASEMFEDPAVANAILALPVEATLLCADRGMLGGPGGIYSDAVLADLSRQRPSIAIERLTGLNHYTILVSADGAAQIASHITPAKP